MNMSEKRFMKECGNNGMTCRIWDNGLPMTTDEVVDTLNEQQSTIEKQKRIIKSQDMEISRQYNLCLAMSGVLREEFGVYDVFDRTKDRKID